VIWLHGLGADGTISRASAELQLDPRHAVRFVLPHAPGDPVTLNGGMVMPAWYDIRDGDLRTRQRRGGIARSADQVARADRARAAARGADEPRLPAGFSQGGAIAVHTALRHSQPLAGIIALSTYLVCAEKLPAELQSANRGIPGLRRARHAGIRWSSEARGRDEGRRSRSSAVASSGHVSDSAQRLHGGAAAHRGLDEPLDGR